MNSDVYRMKARKYELRQRAALQAETRQRIVEAVFALHREIGPARTTISAIAERAGVERLTVYRHFGGEAALFAACAAHFRAETPPPDPAAWTAIDDPVARLRVALVAYYDYYRRAEDMLANVTRDAPRVPALAPFVERRLAAATATRDRLLEGWGARGARRTRLAAAIGLALRFETWQALAREELLSDVVAAELMVRLAQAAQGSFSASKS